MKKIAVLAIAAVTAFSGLTPANAMPLVGAKPVASQSSMVEQVQYRGHDRRGFYNGHRGSRQARPGYRRHSDGFWYPLAALGTAAIIGGIIANQPRNAPAQAGINPRHVDWCSAKYRSYRSYDNTFQPNHGPRQQCYSPYF
jgi:BA14K-like protein.